MQNPKHLWAIILAAGDGKRLQSFGVANSARPVPKQFRVFDGHESMFQWTIKRAQAIVPGERVVTIVAQEHRRWWQGQVSCLPRENVVIQPQNKGTAAGILLPLLSVLERDPAACILVLPSDHYVDNEDLMMGALRRAFAVAQANTQQVILVGMDATQDAADYGWIVPGTPTAIPGMRSVVTFCEKPDQPTMQQLRRRGALVNSLIMVACGRALLHLLSEAIPGLVKRFARLGHKTSALGEIQRIYAELPSYDFSRTVLEQSPEHLWVCSAPHACGWSDLGTPARMGRFLERCQATAA